MKRAVLIVLLSAFLLSMLLAGCGNSPAENTSEQTSAPEADAPEADAPAVDAEESADGDAAESFTFPARTCSYVVAASAGGGFDVVSRAFTNEWGDALGTTFEYLYEDSNSYVMGMNDTLNTGKGEYAVMCGFAEAMQAAYMFQNAPFTLDDIVIIGNIYTDAQGLMVRIDDDRWSSMSELIEYGQTCTEPIKISTPQALTPANIAAKLFVEVTGINATVIEYSGGSGARNDLLGGHVDISIGGMQNAETLRDQVKVIGVLGPENSCKDLWDCETTKDVDYDLPDVSSHCMLWCDKALMTEEPEVFNALLETYQDVITSDQVHENMVTVSQDRYIDYKDAEESLALCEEFAATLEAHRDLLDPALQ